MDRLHQVAANPKEIIDGAMDGEKALHMSKGFKAAHVPFPLAGGLMGDLDTIISVLLGTVMHGRHTDSVGSPIAAQLIGDQPIGDVA